MGLRTALGLKKPKLPEHLNESYSQEGEDGILGRIFENKHKGFFVDVGAHHPTRFSNTHKFYKQGWTGINIDAWPGAMKAFKTVRERDINLEVPISDKDEEIPFYIFNDGALNTFSKEVADRKNGKDIYKIERVVNIRTQTLASILEKYLPENQGIDFLSIDAEGYDLKVLQSNNWAKFRPAIVLVEGEVSFGKFLNSEVNDFMKNMGYEFFAKTVKTYFFKNKAVPDLT